MTKQILILLLLITISVKSQVKTEEVLLKNGKIELSGTLTYQERKQPLLIYIAGSGNVDRNGNQKPVINANYIKQFREAITSENIAFFSYDKRTANLKNRDFLKETIFDDFVSDAKIIINHFKGDKRFTKIVLIGHSQGSLVAMLASENVDKFISLAGAGESIDKVLVRQISKQNKVLGDIVKQHCEELKKTDTIQKVNPFLYNLFNLQNHRFLANWIRYNPAEEIAKLKIPIAIIQGKKDLQVEVSGAEKLHKANPKAKLFLIENMNHVLKTISNKDKNKELFDNQNSYVSPKYPVSKELVKMVKNFILND